MANVVAVNPKGDKAAILVLDDGSNVWTPELDKAKDLIGKPIPSNWTQKQGEYGPQAFPPREGGGKGAPAAFRNTREGFLLEQDSIHRSVAMQTAAAHILVEDGGVPNPFLFTVADAIYAWLRSPSTAVQSLPAVADKGAGDELVAVHPAPTSSAGRSRAGRPADKHEAGGEPGDMGKVEPAPSAPCDHEWTDTKPDGTDLPRTFGRCVRCGLVMKGAFA